MSTKAKKFLRSNIFYPPGWKICEIPQHFHTAPSINASVVVSSEESSTKSEREIRNHSRSNSIQLCCYQCLLILLTLHFPLIKWLISTVMNFVMKDAWLWPWGNSTCFSWLIALKTLQGAQCDSSMSTAWKCKTAYFRLMLRWSQCDELIMKRLVSASILTC